MKGPILAGLYRRPLPLALQSKPNTGPYRPGAFNSTQPDVPWMPQHSRRMKFSPGLAMIAGNRLTFAWECFGQRQLSSGSGVSDAPKPQSYCEIRRSMSKIVRLKIQTVV